MRRTHSFTLIEILVVIAIIGILAGLVFPALNRARSVSQATTCLNNKRSLGQVVNSYALDNDRRIPFVLKDKPYSWYFRGYTKDQNAPNSSSTLDTNMQAEGRVYMSFVAMRCPLAKIEKKAGKEVAPQIHVSAMFDTGDTGSGWWSETASGGSRTMEQRFGSFRIKNGNSDVDYSLRHLRAASNLPLFADAFGAVAAGKNPLEKSTWKFTYDGDTGGDAGRIALLHQDKATIGYADGHADQQDKSGLEAMGLENFYSGGFKELAQ